MKYRYVATWPLEFDTPAGRVACGYGDEIRGMDPQILQRKLDCGHARREEIREEEEPSLSMTKDELKRLAREARLDDSGPKRELLARIQGARQQPL